MRSRYHGHKRPDPQPQPAAEKPHPWDAIFERRTANLALAYAIVGINATTSEDDAKQRYRRLQLLWHPDCGGELRRAMHLNCAWEYIRAVRHW